MTPELLSQIRARDYRYSFDACITDLYRLLEYVSELEAKLAVYTHIRHEGPLCDGCGKTIAEHTPLMHCRPTRGDAVSDH